MQYRKKPVVIEAVQWTRDNEEEVTRFLEGVQWYSDNGINIPTLEGTMKAQLGDWIIKGVQGEFYPCKPDIFEATYEPVDGHGAGLQGTGAAL